jgi:5-methylthioribose kinase
MSEALTRALLLDIEGTTSSLSFVKDELFPYARARLPSYVTEHAPALGDVFEDVRRIEGNAALDTQQLIATLLRWIGEDRKLTPLKSLQGLIWEEGFARGELRGHLYEDAVEALRAWHAAGLKLYIYSSGSILAQRLIFSHTEYGDLTPYFSGYFDTTIGGKLEPDSYRSIAAQIGQPPAAVLFLSDHPAEITAAAIAGMQAIQVCRDPAGEALRDRTRIANFAGLHGGGSPHPAGSPRKSRATPSGYRTLNAETVADYLMAHSTLAERLGNRRDAWRTREVGDGNLNLVFIVEGPAGSLIVKQALPYVRLVGSGWPLPLSRSHFEHLALAEQARWAAAFVPGVYHADSLMALIVMEYLSPHIVLRKGLVRGEHFPLAGRHLGTYLGHTLFHTSDLYLKSAVKKERIGAFLANSAMCKISEDLIFDEPYFAAPLNRHTQPQLDALAESVRRDAPLKLAVQELKARFLSDTEALLHGDLHTGSVLATVSDTRVIDPEFAFYGPMGFDIGAIIGNFLLAHTSQRGHERTRGGRDDYRSYLLQQVDEVWTTFAQVFADLWRKGAQGDLYSQRLLSDAPELRERAIAHRLQSIWDQSVGYAACKMIRRILGLAHVEDFEAIADPGVRADCERSAVALARDMLLNRRAYRNVQALIQAARQQA